MFDGFLLGGTSVFVYPRDPAGLFTRERRMLVVLHDVILFHFVFLRFSVALSVGQCFFDDAKRVSRIGGCTSLLVDPFHTATSNNNGKKVSSVTIVAGGKNGTLHLIDYYDLTQREPSTTTSFASVDDGLGSWRPSPIYSLAAAVSHSDITLFCGGGDRYVTVWKCEQQLEWHAVQRLGPHTGWVKDVLLVHPTIPEAASSRLFSIGCNYIETWACERTRKRESLCEWVHVQKSLIESDPKQGSTLLSSDLLCLEVVSGAVLVSGGVDGRVHAWDPFTMKAPLISFAAHDGRVNALAVGPRPADSLLFSVGNDGVLKSWKYCSTQHAFEQVGSYSLGFNARGTALTSWQGPRDELHLCVGTSSGALHFLSCHSDGTDLGCWDTKQIAGQPVINAIGELDNSVSSNMAVFVAHSLGIDLLTYYWKKPAY